MHAADLGFHGTPVRAVFKERHHATAPTALTAPAVRTGLLAGRGGKWLGRKRRGLVNPCP